MNNLVLNGTLLLGNTDGSLYGRLYVGTLYSGSQTISGNATVLFGGSGNNGIYNYNNGNGVGATLTIAPTVTLRGKAGFLDNNYPLATIVNQGTISADVAGGQLSLGGTGTFTNQATLSAFNGGTLSINGAWNSTLGSTITVNNSTLNLGGSFTQTGLTLDRTGGTVNLVGTVTGNLVLDATTGAWNMAGGALHGGTLTETGVGQLLPTSSGGTLDGMTVNGDLDLSQQNTANLTVMNNLVLNGTLSLGTADGSLFGRLYVGTYGSGSQTISGNATVVFGGSSNNGIYNYNNGSGAGATLTIAPTVALRGTAGFLDNNYPQATIVVQGEISAEAAGGQLRLGGTGTFIAQATASALTGGTLSINGSTVVDDPDVLRTTADGTILLTGSLSGNTHNISLFKTPGRVQFNGGTAGALRLLEAMSSDGGNVAASFTNNFAYGTLTLGSNSYVRLVDQSDNAAGAARKLSMPTPSWCQAAQRSI